MVRLLGIEPGSVTPLAAFNNQAHEVKLVNDSRLASVACANVHPLRNTATLGLSGADLLAWFHALFVFGHRAIAGFFRWRQGIGPCRSGRLCFGLPDAANRSADFWLHR